MFIQTLRELYGWLQNNSFKWIEFQCCIKFQRMLDYKLGTTLKSLNYVIFMYSSLIISDFFFSKVVEISFPHMVQQRRVGWVMFVVTYFYVFNILWFVLSYLRYKYFLMYSVQQSGRKKSSQFIKYSFSVLQVFLRIVVY